MYLEISNESTLLISNTIRYNPEFVEISTKSSNYKHFLKLTAKQRQADEYKGLDWEHPELKTRELDKLIFDIKLACYNPTRSDRNQAINHNEINQPRRMGGKKQKGRKLLL